MTALLVIGMAPLIWSAILSGARRLAGPRYMPQDGVEKILLGLMLAPVLLGLGFVVTAPFLPVNLSAPVFARQQAAGQGEEGQQSQPAGAHGGQ